VIESSETVLGVTSLSVSFNRGSKKTLALDNVTFSLKEGEILGIIGESGAGKTTLGMSLIGLLGEEHSNVSGEVMFQGSDLLRLSEKALCGIRGGGIGMIFQDARGSLDPCLGVKDQLARSIAQTENLTGAALANAADRLLEDVGLDPKALELSRYPHQLSGGQCQRASIAMVLARKPKVLIADEPTSSLDTVTQSRIVSLLVDQVKTRNISMIFISHNLPLISNISDSVMILRTGRNVDYGTGDILWHSSNDYTQQLFSAWMEMSAQGVGGPGIA
jgi:ABC-type glutathione transport system ATPase component